ncbi:cytosine permease [Nocardia sp. NPDC052001]|uniref:purine-cytosine permease family protein n=1 Tax=Nocardia sp. NPDC052001 TaxID=3154853 RepID=UPI00343C87B5
MSLTAPTAPTQLDPPAPSWIEKRGIDHIPATERTGSVRSLMLTWAGCVLNVTTLTYGALLIAFGLNIWQALGAIALGNLTWLVTGLLSLPGPATGSTAFIGSRAAFGRNGNRLPAIFNWLMQVGYETVDLSIMVLSAKVLLAKAGLPIGNGSTAVILLVMALLQSLLPIIGHAAITRALRVLAIPFVVLFAVMAGLTAHTLGSAPVTAPASWQVFLAGIALSASASGLGWTANASDYSRYLPAQTSRIRIVLGVALGGGIPQIALMALGALVATLVPTASDPISGLPTAFPAWFLVPYLLAVIVQMIAVNAFDLYSSGVTLQAIGLKVSRWQAIALDAVVATVLAAFIVYSASFNTVVTSFLLFMIIWFAPWAAIYSVDFLLRRGRYDIESVVEPRGGRYHRPRGLHSPGLIAQFAGMAAAALCIDTSIWTGPVAAALGGADLSVPAGALIGGLVYFLLARTTVPAEHNS